MTTGIYRHYFRNAEAAAAAECQLNWYAGRRVAARGGTFVYLRIDCRDDANMANMETLARADRQEGGAR
jgi:hypothetical protein